MSCTDLDILLLSNSFETCFRFCTNRVAIDSNQSNVVSSMIQQGSLVSADHRNYSITMPVNRICRRTNRVDSFSVLSIFCCTNDCINSSSVTCHTRASFQVNHAVRIFLSYQFLLIYRSSNRSALISCHRLKYFFHRSKLQLSFRAKWSLSILIKSCIWNTDSMIAKDLLPSNHGSTQRSFFIFRISRPCHRLFVQLFDYLLTRRDRTFQWINRELTD